jgi:hypothetical protein
MVRALFDVAREPKQLWIVPGATHGAYRAAAGSAYDARLAGFFDKALAARNQP